MKKQMKKKKKRREGENTFCPESSLAISTRQSVSLPLRHYWKIPDDISLLVKLSPRTSAGAPFIKLIEPY